MLLTLVFSSVLAAFGATPPSTSQTDANIARLTARILERSHYAQKPLDDNLSRKFLDRYLTMLDPMRVHFLASDVKEFEPYQTTLDDLVMKRGDTSAGQLIFDRFMKRLSARVAYAEELLDKNEFDFTGNDRYGINRKDSPYPKNLAEAKSLWRQHLRYEYLQEKLNNKKPEEIQKALKGRYTRLQRNLKELADDRVFEIFLSSLARVYDPHSDYMGKSTTENFAISMKLSLVGIGAELTTTDEGYCQIRRLMAGGPAEKSKKLKAGDKIVAVAQGDKEPVDVVDMPLPKAVELIRGEKGTEVRLTIIPADAPDPSVRKLVTLIRDEIKLEDQEAKAKIIDIPGQSASKTVRLGVIDLPSFYADMRARRGVERKSTTADVAKLLKKLIDEKVQGVVLDLRHNGGGALEESINLTGLFIKKGPVVQVKDPVGNIEVESDADPSVLYEGPLIILTSRFSASASEILAGALQDYGRAIIVGDSSTHGKGTVQSLLELEPIMLENRMPFAHNPGALKFTIKKFYRASGGSTQLRGVVPDIILPSVNNYAEVGEGAMEGALPYDEVPPETYEKLGQVSPYLEDLRKRSTWRIDSDPDFAYVKEDIEIFKKALAEKSVSLNEAQRLKEKKEVEARAEARKKERKARPTPDLKIYEITLKNALEPGLPKPVVETNTVAAASSHTTPVPKSATPGEEDEDTEPAIPPVDVTMVETRRILADYIQLLSTKPPAQANLIR